MGIYPDLDFTRNCVFIDEAGFNLRTQRNYGRSRKGTPAKGIIPTAKGVTITILGAISLVGVIDISLKKPLNPFNKLAEKIVNHGSGIRHLSKF